VSYFVILNRLARSRSHLFLPTGSALPATAGIYSLPPLLSPLLFFFLPMPFSFFLHESGSQFRSPQDRNSCLMVDPFLAPASDVTGLEFSPPGDYPFNYLQKKRIVQFPPFPSLQITTPGPSQYLQGHRPLADLFPCLADIHTEVAMMPIFGFLHYGRHTEGPLQLLAKTPFS